MDISSIKKAYRRYAPAYDFYFGLTLSQGRSRVVEKMGCRAGDRILEVGVGTGLSLPLYDPSLHVTGIDISPEMLERAHSLVKRRRLTNVEGLWEMDAERMDFPDDSFDKVAAMYVVTVVPDPIQLVREMRRVCKPDGELFIVNHFQNPNPVIGACERLLAPLSHFLGFDPAFPLDRFLAETGLVVEESCPVNFFGFWTLLRTVNDKEADDFEQDLQRCN
ncbi:MAG TPA: methyltransferase domain-containing protein [Geobacteraceae bacterium]|jgi:phosphatidylethanolamine/phosphatidyl-N-methylethanolamine N-methyltransferase|nr:methyltransferase domain-containing protein [Geobacteraceae bacterium]